MLFVAIIGLEAEASHDPLGAQDHQEAVFLLGGNLVEDINSLVNEDNDDLGNYYRSSWEISLSQYRAWIAVIARSESAAGRYVTHSQGELGSDVFNHKDEDVGEKFRFSTGLGAFQLDRGGGAEEWGNLASIDKMNPEQSLRSVLRFHRNKFQGEQTLSDFQDFIGSNIFFGTGDEGRVARFWDEITQESDWDETKETEEDIKFAPETVNDPFLSKNSVQFIGKRRWNVNSPSNLKGCLKTWLIYPHDDEGKTVTTGGYYYTVDRATEWEAMVWNDPDNALRYIFERDFSGDVNKPYLPQNVEENTAGRDLEESAPALNPNAFCSQVEGINSALILDKSGSMSESKLRLTQTAASLFTQRTRAGDKLTITAFNQDGQLVSGLKTISSDRPRGPVKQEITRAINTLTASGETNFGAGLQVALDQLQTASPSGPVCAILMSNGKHNSGRFVRQVEKFRTQGWPIHTIAFGSDANEPTLRSIATTTGGSFFPAAKSVERFLDTLNRIQNLCRSSSEVSFIQNVIAQDQELLHETPSIDTTQGLEFLLSWSGSDLDLALITPSGREITATDAANDSRITHMNTDVFEYYLVRDPKPGQWKTKVIGTEISQPEEFNLSITTDSDRVAANFVGLEDQYTPGAEIPVILRLQKGNQPVTAASVEVSVRKPNGRSTAPVDLFDDGNHHDQAANDGIYGAVLADTEAAGIYTIEARISADGFGQQVYHQIRVGNPAHSIERLIAAHVTGCPEEANHPDLRICRQEIEYATWLYMSDEPVPGNNQNITRETLYKFTSWYMTGRPVNQRSTSQLSSAEVEQQLHYLMQKQLVDQLQVTRVFATLNLTSLNGKAQFTVEGTNIQSISIQIYDLTGQKVRDSGIVPDSQWSWGLRTQSGTQIANGVYLYVATIRGVNGEVKRSEVKKLVVLR